MFCEPLKLLENAPFKDIIKIKTIGSTYMAASGLQNPTGATTKVLVIDHYSTTMLHYSMFNYTFFCDIKAE